MIATFILSHEGLGHSGHLAKKGRTARVSGWRSAKSHINALNHGDHATCLAQAVQP